MNEPASLGSKTEMGDPSGSDSSVKKKEAYLTLESFILYRANNVTQSYVIFPRPREMKEVDGRTTLVLDDIPFPEGIPHPKNALTALYGFRDALEELQRQLRFARENQMDSIKVTFKVPVRTIVMGTTDAKKLPETDFLNLRRLQSSLADIIIDGVNNLLGKESQETGLPCVSYSKITEACRRPDLVCDVIRSEKIFSHIKAVAYMIPDETNASRGRQVATVFTDKVEALSFRGDMPFGIEFPKLS